jgi:hypothetical protein
MTYACNNGDWNWSFGVTYIICAMQDLNLQPAD